MKRNWVHSVRLAAANVVADFEESWRQHDSILTEYLGSVRSAWTTLAILEVEQETHDLQAVSSGQYPIAGEIEWVATSAALVNFDEEADRVAVDAFVVVVVVAPAAAVVAVVVVALVEIVQAVVAAIGLGTESQWLEAEIEVAVVFFDVAAVAVRV